VYPVTSIYDEEKADYIWEFEGHDRERGQPLVILDRLTEISGDDKQLRGAGNLLTSLGCFRNQNVSHYHHFLDQAVSINGAHLRGGSRILLCPTGLRTRGKKNVK